MSDGKKDKPGQGGGGQKPPVKEHVNDSYDERRKPDSLYQGGKPEGDRPPKK